MMLKLLVLICVISQEAHGCQTILKHLDEEEVISCSSMLSTGITWLFNNQSEVGPGVVVFQEGRSIVIPSSDKSVYGDYSCFQNNTFVNCSSLYISGECNITCAGLTTDTENTTFSIGSTIIFHLTVNINLSPTDRQGGFILYKDEAPLNRENVTFDTENFTYRLYNAQPTDSGVYYAEHISINTMLFTNRLFINVTNVSSHNPSTASQQHTSTSTAMEATSTAHVTDIITTDDIAHQTPTANGKSNSSDTVGIAVGVSIAVLVLVLVLAGTIIIGIVIYKSKNTGDDSFPTEESCTEEAFRRYRNAESESTHVVQETHRNEEEEND